MARFVTGFNAAISSLLPLNAIPYDRIQQASESRLINRYARQASRDKAKTSSRRRTSKVTRLFFFVSFLKRKGKGIIIDKTV